MKFRTRNSVYAIDSETMTWRREVLPGQISLFLLADEGPIAVLPEPVVGRRCMILEGPMGIHEVVYTSTVIEILEP